MKMNVRKNAVVRPLCVLLLVAFLVAVLPGASAAIESRVRAPANTPSYTFKIDLMIDEIDAYAGIQFGLTLSDESALQNLEFTLGEETATAYEYPENAKNGVHYFGFFTSTNAYQGPILVGQLQITYTGSTPQTITISEMSVLRVVGKYSTRSVKPLPIYKIYVSRDSGELLDDDTLTIEISDDGVPLAGLPGTFQDVYVNDWYFNDVEYVYARGLMLGTDQEHMYFSPQMLVTRAMVTTVLYRDAGSPDVSNLPLPFADLPDGTWYTDAIKWGEQNGIVLGYGNGNCGPDDPITREQLATLVSRYEQVSGKIPEDTMEAQLYADQSSISSWAVDAVRLMATQGIMNGKPGGLFDPQGATTRAELATVLHRLIEAVEP